MADMASKYDGRGATIRRGAPPSAAGCVRVNRRAPAGRRVEIVGRMSTCRAGTEEISLGGDRGLPRHRPR
jgi:hypothetical protein